MQLHSERANALQLVVAATVAAVARASAKVSDQLLQKSLQ
jgi:hypothetical protein